MGQCRDLTGKKFDMLTVIRRTSKRTTTGSVIWECRCDCGAICERSTGTLNSKHAKHHSCGCLRIQTIKEHQYVNKKPFNDYVIEDQVVKIYSDTIPNKFVTIDLRWLEYFKDYHLWYDKHRDSWSIFQNGKNVDIHQIIGGKGCDHKDQNRDNCLESNLRSATHAQNCRNRRVRSDSRTGYKGVREKHPNKFQGYVCCDGKEYRTKFYDTAEEAAVARDVLAKKYHKEFAYLNFPEDSKLQNVKEDTYYE